MAKTLFLDYAGLQKYDGLLKNYVTGLDTKNFKSVAIEGNILKFYTVENPSGTDTYKSVVLPQTDLTDLINRLTTVEGAVATNTAAIATLNGDASTAGSVAKAVKDASDALNNKIGSLDTLKTTAKNTAVAAINEVKDALDAAETSHKVALSVESTPTEGFAKTYTIKQGEAEVGKIDIPKDLVVTSGEIVEDPDADHVGTFIKLVIANQEEALYINVKDLVDIYTAAQGATQVQLAISATNEISATIVTGSIGTTELADNAVTTAKIADGQVTRAKISTEFETQIKALEDAVGEGGNVSTQINNAIAALDADITSAAVDAGKGVQVQVVEVDGKITTVNVTGNYDNVYEEKGAAQALSEGQVTTNKNDIATLKTAVGDGFGAITDADINALFAN